MHSGGPLNLELFLNFHFEKILSPQQTYRKIRLINQSVKKKNQEEISKGSNMSFIKLIWS